LLSGALPSGFVGEVFSSSSTLRLKATIVKVRPERNPAIRLDQSIHVGPRELLAID
jgi:hypothetical protein